MVMRLLNGTAVYVSAWMLVFAGFQIASGVVSGIFDIPAKVFSCYNMYFPKVKGWTSLATVLTFIGAPTAVGFLLVIMANLTGRLLPPDRSVLREFLSWVQVHAFTLIFGNILAGVITNFGAGHAVRAIFGPALIVRVAVGAVCALCMLIVYITISEGFIINIISRRSLADRRSWKQMLVSTVGVWFTGGLVIYGVVFLPVKSGNIPVQNLVLYWLTVVPPIIILPLFRSVSFHTKANGYSLPYSESAKPVKFSPIFAAGFLILCAGWFLVFRRGVTV